MSTHRDGGVCTRRDLCLAASSAASASLRPARVAVAQAAKPIRLVSEALAVSSDQRNPALPEVPTVQQTDVAGYNVASRNVLAAPAGTPADVIDKLNRAARDAVAAPAVQDRLGKLGMRLQASSPSGLQALLGSEMRRWSGVIRAAGIEPGLGVFASCRLRRPA